VGAATVSRLDAGVMPSGTPTICLFIAAWKKA
jgi:hypothetical protein